jgi:two-component system CheB/CheR fusion protein
MTAAKIGVPEPLEGPGGDGSAEAKGDSPFPRQRELPFPIVAFGASAGGLEALRQVFAHLPAEPGMGLIVIQHLDPERSSLLTQVLGGFTGLKVTEAGSGMPVEKNRVYVIPSGSDLSIHHGVLALSPRKQTGRLHLPIDMFFRSLAVDRQARAIGVVLSGSGADGTEGLRAIKSEGGIALVQTPDSAQFQSMPASAIASGIVDFRGTPSEIAEELTRLGRHPYITDGVHLEEPLELGTGKSRDLTMVLSLLRQQGGIDFTGYRRTTVLRRIERRMALRHVGGLEEYAGLLRADVAEARALGQDMLIHVTSFFRDPESFQALEHHAFEDLARRERGNGDAIRVWVPGCSTGEEAYAIAICLLETLDAQKNGATLKLFGSDLSSEAIESARRGVYAESALTDVSPDRLSRFFERVEGGYRIAKAVRDLCVFVRHDLTRDPPFAKLDLISCRNVLIYFDTEMQRRIIPAFHYCLNANGFLFLGQSENVGAFRELFAPVSKDHRIFVKVGDSPRSTYALPASGATELRLAAGSSPAALLTPARAAQRQADHIVLSRYAPAGLIVNDRLEIVQFRGRTGSFLEPPPGQPQANVLRMAREGLRLPLQEALEQARAGSMSVRRERLRVQTITGPKVINLEVVPLAGTTEPAERHFLVLFEEDGLVSATSGLTPDRQVQEASSEERTADIDHIKAELVATQDYLQSLISDNQDASEDLATANQELVASNEELQSTNEELQSAKEELQSANEELSTLNDELRGRNDELDQVANDLVNVLSSVEIPVIILDLQLRVRRFTPSVTQIAGFVPGDEGRPLEDFQLRLRVEDLTEKIRGVIDGISPRDWEVQDRDGRWFRMQIRQYRTADHRLDGVVLSFVDVDVLKHAIEDAEGARDYARGIVETVTSALVVLDPSMHVLSVNSTFCEMFGISSKTVEGRDLFDIASAIREPSTLRRALEEAFASGSRLTGLDITADLPRVGKRVLALNGQPILRSVGGHRFLLAIDEVTDRRSFEEERAKLLESERQSRLEAERANRAKDLFLATLSHELRTPLSTILMSAQILRRIASDNRSIERACAGIERSARAQARLIDDLLDVSRIASGKLLLDLGAVDLEAAVRDAFEIAQPSAQAKSLDFALEVAGSVGAVYGDPARIHQIVNNLLNNAIKFTPRGGQVLVRIEQTGDQAELTVKDTGMGISAQVLPHLFDRFVQADSSVTRTHGGLGLGLAIVRHLVDVHGGQVEAQSDGEGKGSTFRVRLPVGAIPVVKDGVPKLVARSIEGVRVLLVEDDDDTREAYATLLRTLGADVRAESSAANGLAALTEFLPQVILSDIAMPGEDGYSFIRKVRALGPERGGSVPAAALTALARDEDRQQVIQSGFQMHLAKPIDMSQLAGVVSWLAAQGK